MGKHLIKNVTEFVDFAKSDLNIWNQLIEANIRHTLFGEGAIRSIYTDARKNIYFVVRFQVSDDKKFTTHALTQGLINELHIPEDLLNDFKEYIATRKLKQVSSKLDNSKQDNKTKAEDLLNKYNIKALWYITHIDHLSSILKNGLCSRNYCISNGLIKTDISNPDVQSRRKYFHDCVNLYFSDNTPMLYRVIEKYKSSIILLEIDPRLLFLGKIRITDGNAASSGTSFYNGLSYLDKIDWSIVNSKYPAFYGEEKRKRMAEVLIQNNIESKHINCIHVQSQNIMNSVSKILKGFQSKNLLVRCDLTIEGVSGIGY